MPNRTITLLACTPPFWAPDLKPPELCLLLDADCVCWQSQAPRLQQTSKQALTLRRVGSLPLPLNLQRFCLSSMHVHGVLPQEEHRGERQNQKMLALTSKTLEPLRCSKLAIEVAIYRMETGPEKKIPEKWERKWKMAPGPKWPKNGNQNGKMDPKMGFWPDFGHFFHFGGHFSAISGVGPFSIFFPIFPGFLLRARFPFCEWPLQSQL